VRAICVHPDGTVTITVAGQPVTDPDQDQSLAKADRAEAVTHADAYSAGAYSLPGPFHVPGDRLTILAIAREGPPAP